jgi:hypothetical protein
MFQPPSPLNSSEEKHEPGPGIGAGFGIGVLAYLATFLFVFFVAFNFLSESKANTYTLTNLIGHLVVYGSLIWRARVRKQTEYAQALIICAAFAFILDSACWGLLR